MRKHILMMGALTLGLALVGVLSLLGLTAGQQPQPKPKELPVYCALPQPQFAEYGCTVKQTMPGYHPQAGKPESQPLFLPLYPGSGFCRAYYVDDLENGTLTFCPAQDIRHD